MKKVLLLSVCLIVSVLFGGARMCAQSSPNVTFSTDDDKTLTISVSGTTTDTEANSVATQMNNCQYTKVVVVGGVINEKFIYSILLTSSGSNSSIKTLDLSKTDFTETTFPRTIFNPAAYDYRIAQLQLTSFSLPKNILTIADNALCLSSFADVVLPSGLKTIGKRAFVNTKLTSIIFPESLDKIDDAAFFNVKIANLKLNSGLRFIGNAAFAWNNADDNVCLGTLNVPASVKYIGPAAFCNHWYGDVYFHSTKAPLMPYGSSSDLNASGLENTAFTGRVLMGNNALHTTKVSETTMDDPQTLGYANRENYKNGSVYTVVLHYPKTLTDSADIDTYTDYTRQYWIIDGDKWNFSAQKTVGEETVLLSGFNTQASKTITTGYKDTYVEGDYIWPSQDQKMRAYITAVNGVKWNGKDTYRTQLTEEELTILEEAGYKKGETADHDNGVYTLDELQKMAHQGTRMFVLANNDSQKGDDYHIDIPKGGKWWTLCVPFNMTKKQVKETFGDDTNVCLFNKVVRTVSPSKGNHISLYFTLDVCQKHKCELTDKKADGTWNWDSFKDSAAPEDNDIVIQAHESYMIRPSKTDKDAVFVVENYEPEIGNPIETVVTSQVERDVQDAATDTPEYRFIGNYLGNSKVHIPQYSYIYATKDKGTDKKYKFWFITDGGMVWSPNKSVVQTNVHGGGADDYENFFGGKTDAKGAMQSSVFGAEDGTTNIDSMTIIAGEGSDTPVYGVDGRMVSRSGDTTGLAKGIYIQNGRKFIVK